MGFQVTSILGLLLLSSHCFTMAQVPKTIDVYKSGECFNVTDCQRLRSKIERDLTDKIVPQLRGLYSNIPANSCADVYHGHPSGYYWLSAGNEPVYCSVNESRCCNQSSGNWMRIAYLNMSDPSQQCPHGWREVDSPIRTCRRQFNTSINSVNYSSHGIPYSRVCGRIKAYQFGRPDAFLGYFLQHQSTIDDAYVDGLSITYGDNPRHHVWTFVGEKGTSEQSTCQCIVNGIKSTAPPFVSADYFCERGVLYNGKLNFVDHNPLWDGHGCTGSSTCCEFNNPPWFCQQLPEPTTENIEIRLMGYVFSGNSLKEEDTPVELIEIYVQ